MHDDRIGGLLGAFHARDRAALQALLRVGGGVLIRDLGHRETLHGDAEAGLVHHREHRIDAAVLLADEEALRTIVVHHAGRITVDAHLVLDRAAHHAVARSERAICIDIYFRHDEEREALDARRCTFDAREYEVDDVLGQIVLTRRDENLGAGDRVGTVSLLHGLGAREPEIRAAMRLGEVHRAGPFAARHVGQIELFLLVGAVMQESRDRALRQARIHRERDARAAHQLVYHDGHRTGQALPAVFGRDRNAHPATVGILLVTFLEAGRRGDAAVSVALATLHVADAIERLHDLFGQLRGFLQDRGK